MGSASDLSALGREAPGTILVVYTILLGPTHDAGLRHRLLSARSVLDSNTTIITAMVLVYYPEKAVERNLRIIHLVLIKVILV